MFISDKNFKKYMENINSAYVLLAKHVESLERRLHAIDNINAEEEIKNYYEKGENYKDV